MRDATLTGVCRCSPVRDALRARGRDLERVTLCAVWGRRNDVRFVVNVEVTFCDDTVLDADLARDRRGRIC